MRTDEFLDPQGLADFFGIPVRTVYAWRTRGEGPRAHKIGRHVRYRRDDVEDWLESQADQPKVALSGGPR